MGYISSIRAGKRRIGDPFVLRRGRAAPENDNKFKETKKFQQGTISPTGNIQRHAMILHAMIRLTESSKSSQTGKIGRHGKEKGRQCSDYDIT